MESDSREPEMEKKELQEADIQSPEKERKEDMSASTHMFLLVCIVGVVLGIALEILNKTNRSDHQQKLRYWVFAANTDKAENKNGYLKHVHIVLDRLGYEMSSNRSQWSLLWAHDSPFIALSPHLYNLEPHQRVNKLPGTGYLTSKVDFATSGLRHVPKAFRLPKDKEKFLSYVSKNPSVLFMVKNNQHRGVFLRNVSEIDTSSSDSFVQEFVQRPFLVDGHKFDIGVYVAITSVDPLRVYWYKGDVLFRYCPSQYHPLDWNDRDRYVIRDDYRPTWEVPALRRAHAALRCGMKDAFDIYLRNKGEDSSSVWGKVQDAISELVLKNEHHIVSALKKYSSPGSFFELLRVDLILDEDLEVHVLEVNMSPNLYSSKFRANRILYEQVLYNLFSLTGVSRAGIRDTTNTESDTSAKGMISTDKNIAVWGAECATTCQDCGAALLCQLCSPCQQAKLKTALLKAHEEHLHRGDFRRLWPPALTPRSSVAEELENLTPMNKLQYLWYQGKCDTDPTWCT